MNFIKTYCSDFPDDEKLCLDAGEDVDDAGCEGQCPAAGTDVGPDGGTDLDAGCQVDCPCARNEQCPAELPVCEVSSGSCIECSSSNDDLCTSQGKVCLAGGTSCVECNTNTDCKDPGKAVCGEGHTCEPCQTDTDCASVTSGAVTLDACVQGVCVDCRVDPSDTRTDYGCTGNIACDPSTNTCTGKTKSTVDSCGDCVADAECTDNHRCVAMSFKGQPIGSGGFCLQLLSAPEGCSRPYRATPIVRESLSGASAEEFCGVNEAKTTCAAVAAFGLSCDGDKSCEALGARCERVNGGLTCTYSCGSGATPECAEGYSCPSGSDSYCGGR